MPSAICLIDLIEFRRAVSNNWRLLRSAQKSRAPSLAATYAIGCNHHTRLHLVASTPSQKITGEPVVSGWADKILLG
jgi:hypothetical protein